jgi:hypothetical protein
MSSCAFEDCQTMPSCALPGGCVSQRFEQQIAEQKKELEKKKTKKT